MTPMQEPANMPLEVICHEGEKKQASIVSQFQSVCSKVSYGISGVETSNEVEGR